VFHAGKRLLKRGDLVSLVPSCVCGSIFDLKPEVLRAAGVRVVLADLDNTLAPYEQSMPSPAVRQWKSQLEAAGITLFVVSNSRQSRRCPAYCAALGVDYVRHAGKPGVRGFRAALERSGCEPGQAVMVGDQIFTDIWGANRAGIRCVLVKPVAWGRNPCRLLRYALESPFRWAGARKDAFR